MRGAGDVKFSKSQKFDPQENVQKIYEQPWWAPTPYDSSFPLRGPADGKKSSLRPAASPKFRRFGCAKGKLV
jgi:hypothetical protein